MSQQYWQKRQLHVKTSLLMSASAYGKLSGNGADHRKKQRPCVWCHILMLLKVSISGISTKIFRKSLSRDFTLLITLTDKNINDIMLCTTNTEELSMKIFDRAQ